MKLKLGALAAGILLVAGLSLFGQNRPSTSGTSGTITTTTGDVSGVWTGASTILSAATSGPVGWVTADGRWIQSGGAFVPSETRKPITPAVTLTQVRATAKKVSESSLAPASYIKTAKALKVNSAAIEEANMLQELHDHALKVYDYDKVDTFLYNTALKMGSNTRWVWKPLRDADMKESSNAWSIRPQMGFIYLKQYSRAVPERVLNLVANLLECIPDAIFYVSDFEVVKPDPFLAITTKKLLEEDKIYIIAQWDEPSFKDAPDYPVEFVANAVHVR